MARDLFEQQQSLIASLADQPEIAGTLELVWRQARASIPATLLNDWVAACRDLAERIGPGAAIAFIRNSPSVATAAGASAVIALAQFAPSFADVAGGNATTALFVAAPHAARRLGTSQAFAEWLRVIRRIAEGAPESIGLLLDRSARVLDSLDLRAFESWALGGIRAAENDPDRRLKFFVLLDSRAVQALEHAGDGAVMFTDVERELKAFVAALWHMVPPIRVLPSAGFDAPRRPCFGNGVIHVPQSIRGFAGQSGKDLFRATLAHVMAHFQFTGARFAVGDLKPVQIALASLIEDARVEQLAMGRFPGLRRFWLPFHVAEGTGVLTAPALMARLARALIDPSYFDPHGWVNKGRDLFFAESVRWTDPAISRNIGGLLGNDLGQMRVQFNPRAYVAEPAYRDDNQGVWEFPAAVTAEGELAYESVRFEQSETELADRERVAGGGETANFARLEPEDVEVGIPVARYPEWDYLIGRDRADWATVLEYTPTDGCAEQIDRILERYPETAFRISSLVQAAKVSRPFRLRHQREGDRLDLEASITAAIDMRAGLTPSPNVYARLERRWRDLSVLVLIDASQSTNDLVKGIGRSVLELERDATSLLAHAMDEMGDPFAIHAFCSDTREDVHYYRIKDFDTHWGVIAKRRLAGVIGRFSTRMGAALRHAGRDLLSCPSYRKLLLLVSDGEPSDIDISDRRYLVEDARRAVLSMRHQGIDLFCVGLDAGGDSYLTRIFGRSNVIQLDHVDRLPEKLPLVYFRLAG
ncbi:MAG: VWA domain-containing protein [Bradyrhizobiaceae bacterium]|nr:VWA domain-containing protein [Bradyrhizobiaceae bacterium]